MIEDSIMFKKFRKNLLKNGHMPDILDTIANLSNDEVFTSPELANKVLDLLPAEIWQNKDYKWLDPATKTGVFLREVARRLMVGLRSEFPNEEERRQHIFKNMLYGIAITDLTALMSRRSLYTSKSANGKKSIAKFDNEAGNISYDNRPHTYKNGTCIYCGNKQGGELDRDATRERHAYSFIHLTPEEVKNMHFDVIVGNPPYQLKDGGGGIGSAAMPIYQLFVKQAIKLDPRYIAFIIPSRWFVGGRGLDDFRDMMLANRHIKYMVDFPSSADCFPGVDIVGGVCYFVMDRDYEGKCIYEIVNGEEISSKTERMLSTEGCNILVRYNEMISILKKVSKLGEKSFSNIVSSQKPFGLRTDFLKDPSKYNLPPVYKTEDELGRACIRIYGLFNNKRVVHFVPLDYPFPSGEGDVRTYKIFMPSTYGCSAIGENGATPVLGEAILAPQLSACTETFTCIGGWETEGEMMNAMSYIKTKFFRFLVGIKKTTQRVTKDTYSLAPLLDFHKPWTDDELYERYGISEDERNFIESTIKEM